MRSCPKCGKKFTLNERLCPHDGSTLQDVRSAEEQNLGKILAGKYRIDGFLKRGGMGSVYRGTHVMLDKPVAIKLIKPELVTSEDTIRRFQREARAASQLSHPNIVAVYDLGQAEDGMLYIAMELVSGESLKDHVKKQGPMEPHRATRIVKAIASALALAHQNNIIHRDLKPQNIMMTRDNEGREIPKLLDFGIAKTFDPDSPALTSTGMVLGTPQYMSPEQAAGKPVDARADLYSLGIIFYEMLAGKVPFDDPSIPAILVKHLNEMPKRPSELREDLPSSLEQIVLRCLEKDPEKRFAGAEEFSSALASADTTVAVAEEGPTVGIPALTQEPSRVRTEIPPPPLPPTIVSPPHPTETFSEPTVREPGRKKRSPLPILGLIAILLFILGGVSLFLVMRGEDPSDSESADAAALSIPGPDTTPISPEVEEDETPPEPRPDESIAGEDTQSQAIQPIETVDEAEETGADLAPATTTVSPPSPQPTPPPPVPEPEVLPEKPSLSSSCQGLSDACGSVQAALEQAFVKNGIPMTREEGADIVLLVYTEEIEARTEEQFGTTFVVRTYSIEVTGQSPRFNERVSMPAPETFNFDTRFGREKLNERTRVLADAVIEKILTYWSEKASKP
jgi:serine/threonine protein kinase